MIIKNIIYRIFCSIINIYKYLINKNYLKYFYILNNMTSFKSSKIIHKINNAFRGLSLLIIDSDMQKVIIYNSCILLILFVMYLYTNTLPNNWYIIFIFIFISMCSEIINTIIENICNFIHLEYSLQIKNIKDIGAFFALFSHLSPLIILIIIMYYNV